MQYYGGVCLNLIKINYLGGSSIILTSITPTPSQEDSSTTCINLLPSSTQFEAPANVDMKIIVGAIFAGLVLLVAVTIAFMMAMLSSRSCHCPSKNVLVDVKHKNFDQHQVDILKADQSQHYDHL